VADLVLKAWPAPAVSPGPSVYPVDLGVSRPEQSTREGEIRLMCQ
jgi:hypothetical protein